MAPTLARLLRILQHLFCDACAYFWCRHVRILSPDHPMGPCAAGLAGSFCLDEPHPPDGLMHTMCCGCRCSLAHWHLSLVARGCVTKGSSSSTAGQGSIAVSRSYATATLMSLLPLLLLLLLLLTSRLLYTGLHPGGGIWSAGQPRGP
jgi:hypothetical protein